MKRANNKSDLIHPTVKARMTARAYVDSGRVRFSDQVPKVVAEVTSRQSARVLGELIRLRRQYIDDHEARVIRMYQTINFSRAKKGAA